MKRLILIVTILLTVHLILVPQARAQGTTLQDWEIKKSDGTVDTEKSCTVDGIPTFKCIEVVYNNVLVVSTGLVMIVLFVMFVYGGITYLTAFGDSEKIAKGASIIKWSLIGIGVFAGSYLGLRIIDAMFLGGEGKIFQLNIPGPGS